MIKETYDEIANHYDNHYTTPENLKENEELTEMLSDIIRPTDNVLDIGCGTGLLLDLIEISKENYIGLDPSKKMLEVFSRKYPEYTVFQTSYENMKFDKVDVAVALFSAHYIKNGKKKRLLEQADRYLYIFNKPDYAPDWYYSKSEKEIVKHITDYDELNDLFDLVEWHNYLIAYKK